MTVQQIDFTPTQDGLAVDPTLNGGRVVSLALYSTPPPHSGATPVVVSVMPAHLAGTTVWTFTVDVADGTFWAEVTWSRTSAETPAPVVFGGPIVFGDEDLWCSVADTRADGMPVGVSDGQALSLVREATRLLSATTGLRYGRAAVLARCEPYHPGVLPPRRVRSPLSYYSGLSYFLGQPDGLLGEDFCGTGSTVRLPPLIDPVVLSVTDGGGLVDPLTWRSDGETLTCDSGWQPPVTAGVLQGQPAPDDAREACARLAVLLHSQGPAGAVACGLPAGTTRVARQDVSIDVDNSDPGSGDRFVAQFIEAHSARPAAMAPGIGLPGRAQPRVLGPAR